VLATSTEYNDDDDDDEGNDLWSHLDVIGSPIIVDLLVLINVAAALVGLIVGDSDDIHAVVALICK